MGAVTSNNKLTAAGALELNRKLPEIRESLKQKFKYSEINYSDLATDPEIFRQYEGGRFEIHILATVNKGGKPYVLHTLLPDLRDVEGYKNIFLSYIQIIEQVQPYVSKTYLPVMKGWTVMKYNIDDHDIFLPAIVYEPFVITDSVASWESAELTPYSCQDVYQFAIKSFQTLIVTRNLKAGCHFSRFATFFALNGKGLVMLPGKPCNQGANKCDQDYFNDKSPAAIDEINAITYLLIQLMVGNGANQFIQKISSNTNQVNQGKQFLSQHVGKLCQMLLEPLLQTDISNIYTPEAYLEYLRSKPVLDMFTEVSGIEQTDEDVQKIAQDLALIKSANQTAYQEYCSSREPLREVLRLILKCLGEADKTLSVDEKVKLVKQMIADSKVKLFAVCYKGEELEQEISNLANQE